MLARFTRVLPSFMRCRTIYTNRVELRREDELSATDSSAGESSSSEAEDGEEGGSASLTQLQVLRAYMRSRRSRCVGRVREQGLIPAVLVDGDKDRRLKDGCTDVFLSLDAKPLAALLKLIGKRDFVARVFDMEIYPHLQSSELKESLQVLPRNLNYGPGKTNILNIQFMRATPGKTLKLGVPLQFLGADRCPGLKKGGTLRKLAKYVVYNCKATEVPAKIVVDMTVLEIGDRVQVQDLEVNFDHLHSDRTTHVCEIVKDVASLKAKARKLKSEILYKRKALVPNEKTHAPEQSLSTDDECNLSEEVKKEVCLKSKSNCSYKSPYGGGGGGTPRFDAQRQSSRGGKFGVRDSSVVHKSKTGKPSTRRLLGSPVVGKKPTKSSEAVKSRKVEAFIKSASEDGVVLSSNQVKCTGAKALPEGEETSLKRAKLASTTTKKRIKLGA